MPAPIKLKSGIHIDSNCTGIKHLEDGIFIPFPRNDYEEFWKDLDAFLNQHWIPSGSDGEVRAMWSGGELRPIS